MYCNICEKSVEKGIDLLGANICKDCYFEMSNMLVSSQSYDYYKEMIKKILQNYIHTKVKITPVT